MTLPVYLDYAASTPVAPEVVDAMIFALRSPGFVGNPAAGTHVPGQLAAAAVEAARAEVATLIHAVPEEIVFTSGATEADNLAIIGGARFRQAEGRHLVTALTEHKAVLESCRYLTREVWRVTWLKPDAEGIIAPSAVEAALEPDTVLVSVMHANNETGVVQDVGAIGSLCRRRRVLFHVDAAQSAGRLPINVRALQIDLLSFPPTSSTARRALARCSLTGSMCGGLSRCCLAVARSGACGRVRSLLTRSWAWARPSASPVRGWRRIDST
jgi:cysteine desulfurase